MQSHTHTYAQHTTHTGIAAERNRADQKRAAAQTRRTTAIWLNVHDTTTICSARPSSQGAK